MTGASLRALQVIGDFGSGGAGRAAENFALALREAGGVSNCMALRGRSVGARSVEGDVALGIRPGPLGFATGLLKARRFLSAFEPTLVHVHGPGSLVYVIAALQGLRRRTQVWFTWHDSGSVKGARQRSFRWAIARCDRVFGSSSAVAARLSDELGGRSVEVLRNGIPIASASTNVQDAIPTLAWAARLVPDKDPLLLLRVAAALRAEGLAFKVVLAGGSSDRYTWLHDEIRGLVHASGLSDVVSLPGWIADTQTLWTSASIGVQTSQTEGLSMTLLEQAMAGLAIVATEVGDTATVIEDEETGLLLRPRDETALMNGLRRLITDASLRSRLGAAARRRAIDHFSLPELARQVHSRL
jgi:glycosyltransferase involved in cell wall biosynthesis